MRVAGVIIAGGKSSRMGQEKVLMMLNGRPLLEHIIARVAPQVRDLVINANGDTQRFDLFGLTVIPDLRDDIGTPLAGLHAGLSWAKENGFDAIVTVPSDAPFVPRDLAERLGGEHPAVAASGGQIHYLTGFWPTGLLVTLEKMFSSDRLSRESGNPAFPLDGSGAPSFAGVTAQRRFLRVQDFVSSCHARIGEWLAQPYDPFFNVNTPEELAEAERIAAEFHP